MRYMILNIDNWRRRGDITHSPIIRGEIPQFLFFSVFIHTPLGVSDADMKRGMTAAKRVQEM